MSTTSYTASFEGVLNGTARLVDTAQDRFLEALVANAFTLRRDVLAKMMDPRRNIYHECGYPDPRAFIHAQEYQDLYDREPVAARVVGLMPSECWQVQPSIFEDDDPEVVTAFEEAWDALGSAIRGEESHFREEEGSVVWDYLRRVDELSRIAHYGVLLFGLDDGLDLSQPAAGVVERGSYPVEQQYENAEVDSVLRPTEKITVKRPATANGRPVVNYLRGEPPVGGAPYRLYFSPEQHRRITANYSFAGRQETDGYGSYIPPGRRTDDTQTYGRQQRPDNPLRTDEGPGGPRPDPQEEDGAGKKDKGGKNTLKYLRVFPELLAQVTSWEANPHSPRFGQPTSYLITFADPRESGGGIGFPLASRNVHWTRVLHVADTHHQSSSSEVIAVPAMRPVLNPLMDVQKVRSASGEGYWKMGIPGVSFETHPQLGPVRVDLTHARQQVEEWWNSQQRLLIGEGGSFKTLAPAVADPTPFLEALVRHICIAGGWPKRIFEGSERGELASSQDERAHKDRVRQRQRNYLTPRVIVPFVDRLILLGCLPAPAKKGGTLKVKEDKRPTALPAGTDTKEFTKEAENTHQPEGPAKLPADATDPAAEAEAGGFAKKEEPQRRPLLPPVEDDDEEEDGDDQEIVPGSAGVSTERGLGLTRRPDGDSTVPSETPQDAYEAPGGYTVHWPDISAQSEAEQAEIFNKNATAVATMISAGAETMIDELTILTHPKFLNMDEDEALEIKQAADAVKEQQLAQQQQLGDEFGFVPDATQAGMVDPDQADRDFELGKKQLDLKGKEAEMKMEVDKERAKQGLDPGGGFGGPPQKPGGGKFPPRKPPRK